MLLQREGPDLALNSRAGSHQICPLLKVDRPCRRAAATSQLSSRAEEFHLRALPKPCVNLSIHTAPDVRPFP